jgi:hypothetical protein
MSTAFSARILALVACLPLLLPTGVCLCDAGLNGCTETAVVGIVESHDCCNDCRDSDESSPFRPAPGEDHSPNCPASKHEVSPWTKTISSLTIEFVPTVVLPIAAPIDAGSSATTTHVSNSFWPSAPPRYLSHCALLF